MSDVTESILHAAADEPDIVRGAAHVRRRGVKRPVPASVLIERGLLDADQRNSDEEAQRLNAAHLLAQSMSSAADAVESAALDAFAATAPLHKKFKKVIGVDSGSTLRAIEDRVRAAHPTLPEPAVRTRARNELKAQNKKTRLQWNGNAPDAVIKATLHASKDAATKALVEEFEDTHIDLSAPSADEAAVQHSFTAVRRVGKKRSLALTTSLVADANALLNGTTVAGGDDTTVSATPPLNEPTSSGESAAAAAPPPPPPPHAEPSVVEVTDRSQLRNSVLEVADTFVNNSGLVTRTNVMGEVISPQLHPLSAFVRYFVAGKVRTDESLASSGARFLEHYRAHVVNGFMKLLDAAPADACLTAPGRRPSGSAAYDLQCLLEHDAAFDTSAASKERLHKYQALWAQTHTLDQADVESALAVRATHINREKAADMMRALGMSEADVQSALLNGGAAEQAAFLRAVFASINTEAFQQAEAQAEQETNLARRVADAQQRGHKPPSAKKGGRGREALGLAPGGGGGGGTTGLTTRMLGIQLERVTKQYLQSFMRPPILDDERACVLGERCLCLTLAATFPALAPVDGKGAGFIGREFLLPSQLNTYQSSSNGTLPRVRQMCVICDRGCVTAMVHHCIETCQEPNVPLHTYDVEVDTPDGYRADLLLHPVACDNRGTGIVGPFPALNIANLVYGKVTINKCLYSCLVESGTDFRTGSASTRHT